jgi:hypothetical protein
MRKEPLAIAWLHAESGSMQCAPGEMIQPEGSDKVRWPHIQKSPHHVAHLREIIARLETPMMPNTKAATLACLDELLSRLNGEREILAGFDPQDVTESESPNTKDEPRSP